MRAVRRVVSVSCLLLGLVLVVPTAGVGAAAPTAPAVVHRLGTYQVNQVWRTFVDTTRPTPSNGTFAGSDSRRLRTLILLPKGNGVASHRVPLVIFSPGFDSVPQNYSAMLHDWATAGYVVAAITFPGSASNSPGGPDLADLPNQPDDVRFVIAQVTALEKAPGNVLSGRVNVSEIAITGHSLGAVTTLALAANTCCRDQSTRIRAAIVLSGQMFSVGSGKYFPKGGHYPAMLYVNGTKDPLVPNPAASAMYAASPKPKYQMIMHNAPHVDFIKPWGTVINHTVVAMLNHYLVGTGTVQAILKAGTVHGVAQIKH
jgi:predicted dienelactone hydrolase